MVPSGHTLALLALSSLVAGCYLSHERTPSSAPHDAAIVLRDAGTDAPLPPCTWRALEPWQLTSPPGDQRHHEVLATESGYLVAYGSSNDPPPEPGRYVYRISTTRPIGDHETIFPSARGTFLGGVGLATNGDEVLAATWDDAGCLVRRLSASGRALADATAIGRPSCVGVEATASGWALFDRPGDAPARRLVLDPSATSVVSESAPLAVLDGAFWWARARHGDGTTLLVGMRPGVEPTSAIAQRIDASGSPIGAASVLPAFAAASRVRAIATPGGALVGWLEAPGGDPTSQERELRVFSVDESGRPRSMPRTISTGPAYRDAGWSLTAIDDGVLAAYVESEPGDRFGRTTHVVVLVLSTEGELRARLDLPEGELLRAPLVRARAREAIVVYTRLTDTTHQVHVVGLACD